MKKIKLILSIAAIIGCSSISFAQQDVQFTQYMFNGLALNPAYAGSHDALSATLLFREQWVNIDGRPRTQTFSIHTPFISERIGVGLQLIQDKVGIFKTTNVNGSYSYWIPTGKNSRLAMGLQAGVTVLNSNFDDLQLVDQNDDDFTGNVQGTKPNFGAGLYHYSRKHYVGVSAPRLFNNTFESDGSADFKQIRHFYATGGYVIDFGPNFKLKPNVLLKMVQGAPLEADLNLNALFVEKFWLGVSWRSFDSFDILAEYLITPQLRIGYAYDITLTDLRKHTSGSHEFMLNYIFNFGNDKLLTPRYF